ncbi:hypothetical protein LDENG_00028160 [Lucifuga dentata]|nr:hypothetical protein LDENG_00028160 [Lucifuga dentata]
MNWKLFCPIIAALVAVGWAGLMPGAPMTIDVNDPSMQNALHFAVKEHNKVSNDLFFSNVTEVIRAERQVVSGLKYIITVRMARTSCRKSSMDEVCAVHEDPEKARPYQCTFTVWSQPWLQTVTLLKQECKASESTM